MNGFDDFDLQVQCEELNASEWGYESNEIFTARNPLQDAVNEKVHEWWKEHKLDPDISDEEFDKAMDGYEKWLEETKIALGYYDQEEN